MISSLILLHVNHFSGQIKQTHLNFGFRFQFKHVVRQRISDSLYVIIRLDILDICCILIYSL